MKTAIERFNIKVDKSGDCWLWTASVNWKGYGQFYYEGRQQQAHRVSWKIYKGEIPNGLFVLHHCDNPSCVNPDHLWVGTNSDNMQDMLKKGRENYAVGENANNTKLTEDDVINIKKIYQTNNYTHQEIASLFGVSRTLITFVLNGRRWKHVPMPCVEGSINNFWAIQSNGNWANLYANHPVYRSAIHIYNPDIKSVLCGQKMKSFNKISKINNINIITCKSCLKTVEIKRL